LDIAEGLKQLLIDADITIDSIIGLGYRELSEMLHIDLYVSGLIIKAAQEFVQEKSQSRYIRTIVIAIAYQKIL
jgi:hypothetical protein